MFLVHDKHRFNIIDSVTDDGDCGYTTIYPGCLISFTKIEESEIDDFKENGDEE